VLVVDGEVEVDGGGCSVSGGPGFLAIWDPHERHEVRAVEDSRFLLFLAPWPGEGHHT
jgi:quercetin dioxygenase-like cupin family protein